MAIRKLVSEIENEKIKFDKYEKVIFAGFNSLSKSEERIISHLVKSGKTELFWDTDEYYINDDSQEAGKYLRKNFKSFDIKSPQWVENNLIGNQNDTIKIIGAPLNLGQAKALGDVLNDIIKNDSIGLENSAVILPDENLLLPVLYSIPKEVNKINVTMGFPLQNTSLYNLFELLKNLQLNKKPSGKSCVYYHKDVIEILMNPYVKYSNPEYIFNLVNYIKRYSIIYITPKKIIGFEKNCPELLKLIFQAPYSMNEIFDYIYKILNLISTKYDKSDNDYTGFELEYFYTVYEQMNRLKDIIEQYNESVEETTFWHILIESLGSIKIPFTGEPLEGLQIMGLLESRALDFDNIFLLSVNEGILPKGNSHSSFIPYNLRKAFKLPTYEDEDSISAYYFYRLIQRAKRIFLFYNTENDNLYSGEKSRFLLQLETELNDNSNIKVKNFICQAPVDKLNKNEISVAKSPALIERMKNEHHYSASDIINYINCELKFYFKKLAKLQEEEGVEEYFSPSTFGKIFHGVMQILYRDYVNKIIDEKAIENIKKALKSNYDSIFDEVFQSIDELKEMSSAPQGKNLLFKNVIKKLVLKVLDNELNEIPFRLIELEMKVSKVINVTTNGEQNEVELQGRIDRIDEKNGVKRIIDYKTGKVNNSGKSMDNNKMLEEIFENPFYKENFQASFYGYLYLSSHKENDIKMGIYPVKTLDKGIISIKNIDLSLEGYKNFENKLSRLFSEIFDFNQPFKQTTDTNRCEFCPYISICYRE